MKKRIIIGGAAVCVLLLLAGGYWLFTKGHYSPGMVRAEKELRDSLTPPAQPEEHREHWQVARDIRLFHFSAGTGEDILFVHGGPGAPPYAPFPGVRDLGARYRVHFYHQRGCGLSTRPVDRLQGNNYERVKSLVDVLGIQESVADIERIRRILGKEKLVLVGHSFGGFLATLYAMEFPEHVKALVLVAPANLFVFPPEGQNDLYTIVENHLQPADRAEFIKYKQELMSFEGMLNKSDAELTAFNNRFTAFYLRAIGFKPEASPQNLAGIFRAEGTGGFGTQGIFFSLGLRYNYRSNVKEIRVPALVMHGQKDLIPAENSRAVADLLPGARFHMFEKSGHMPFADEPAEFARVAGEFLDTVH